jgi:hypothetical protein
MKKAGSLGTELVGPEGGEDAMKLLWSKGFYMVSFGLTGAVFEVSIGVLALYQTVLYCPIQRGFELLQQQPRALPEG